jgi:hypothetical protein
MAAYPAIKTADPNSTVVYGGLAYNDYGFLEASYQADPTIGNYFDAVAVHPYTANGVSPETVEYGSDGRISQKSFTGFRVVHDDMIAHGDNKPIWLTEFGWATLTTPHPTLGGVDAATQADYLTRAYRLLEGYPYVQMALWYNLRNSGDGDNWTDQLGLLYSDFSPKPSYCAFKSYAAPPITAGLCSNPAASPPIVPGPTTTGGSTTTTRSTTTGSSSPDTAVAAAPTRTVLHLRTRREAHGNVTRISMFGVVSGAGGVGAGGGRVALAIQRRVGSVWHTALRFSATVDRLGRYGVAGHVAFRSTWRVRAVYVGGNGYLRSLSSFAYMHAR